MPSTIFASLQRHKLYFLSKHPTTPTVHWKWCPQLQMKRKGKNITTFVIFKIKCQHVLLLLFFLLPLVSATVHFMFYSYLSLLHRIRRRRKRKIVITISNGKIMFVCRLIWVLVVVYLAKNFYLIHTRNEMSANSEEKEEENPKFKHISLSSFVTSFYSSVYVHLFVHLFTSRKAATTYCLFLLL